MGRERRVNVRLDDRTGGRVDRQAAARGLTPAEYVRGAIARQVAQDEEAEVAKRR